MDIDDDIPTSDATTPHVSIAATKNANAVTAAPLIPSSKINNI